MCVTIKSPSFSKALALAMVSLHMGEKYWAGLGTVSENLVLALEFSK
jgi:hypothetical protein